MCTVIVWKKRGDSCYRGCVYCGYRKLRLGYYDQNQASRLCTICALATVILIGFVPQKDVIDEC